MFSSGIDDANQGTKDFRFYYGLITQHRKIPREREDCWISVAIRLTQSYRLRLPRSDQN